MSDEKRRNRLRWLGSRWAPVAWGALTGLGSGMFFLTSGLLEYRNGENAVGTAYTVLAVMFPVGVTAFGWLTGRN